MTIVQYCVHLFMNMDKILALKQFTEGVEPPECMVWLETSAYLQELGKSRKRPEKSDRSGLRWGLEVSLVLGPEDLTTARFRSKRTGAD